MIPLTAPPRSTREGGPLHDREPKYDQSSSSVKRGCFADCGSPTDVWCEDEPEPVVLIGMLDHREEWPVDYFHGSIESKVA